MKIICVLVLGVLCFMGCASVKYVNPETKEEFKYSRLGWMKINGFSASIDKNGTKNINLESSEGTSGDLGKALINITEVIKNIPIAVP